MAASEDGPGVWRPLVRLVVIVTVSAGGALLTLGAMLGGLLTGGRRKARRQAYRGLVRTLQALGPTFIKFGQTAGARRDALPAALADEMETLHDRVRPMSRRRAERALAVADVPGIAEVDLEPRASGSIACVYRAVLDDGREVALKLKRPGIEPRMRADLALVRGAVRLLERSRRMRGMPMADLAGYVGTAILGQLDFAAEARNSERLRACLAVVPHVRVPAVHPELCRDTCLVFEYLPGLDTATPGALPAGVRAELAERTLEAAGRMMFMDGFVHCDLHPGNVYITQDQRVVILDAGYCVQLPDRVRELIGDFFGSLGHGDGERCAEIILESAVDAAHVDRGAFAADMREIVGAHAGPGNAFDMKVFGDKVFALQQKHGIYAASDFAFPLMSLTVLDGMVRRLSTEVDFQRVGSAGAEGGDPRSTGPG